MSPAARLKRPRPLYPFSRLLCVPQYRRLQNSTRCNGSRQRGPYRREVAARTIGATSVPSNSIDRFIAAVSSEAVLIWNVMRERPPRISLARSILPATVFGSPTRKAPSGPHMASNCWRDGADQPRSRPIVVVRGRPNVPARAKDCGVPPTPSHTGRCC